MTFRALFYAYIIGGLTFFPLLAAGIIFYTVYTSIPVGDADTSKEARLKVQSPNLDQERDEEKGKAAEIEDSTLTVDDIPKTRKGWLTMRRTYEKSVSDGSYVMLMRSFLDSRSKDPKRSRPKDMWYVVLKGTVLYLYEDEGMTECEAAVEVSGHDVVIYPEGLLDGELFTKRNAICLKPKVPSMDKGLPSVTREMKLDDEPIEPQEETGGNGKKKGKEREKEREKIIEGQKKRKAAREEATNSSTPWFIFVRSNVEMEDWYFSLVHASDHPANSPTLTPLKAVFRPADMKHLLLALDSQPDVVPMRWLNALIGRIFFSHYRTRALEDEIIRRLMKKLSKVKRPAFLTDIVVTEVSVGNRAPFLSKPMLKELTKEGDAALEVHLQYKGEIRITVEATATINLGARFKSYTVKLVLAAVLRELEGNLLIKVKRPPSSRIWYAFTQTPRMVLDVEPIVSDRQITWSMILNTIEARLKEIIQESVVMPNMDDISFFESSLYQHRGGIWPDASRREKTLPIVIEPVLDAISVPLLDGAMAIPPSQAKRVPLQRSQSAEDLRTPTSTRSPPEGVVVAARSLTEGTSEKLGTSGTSNSFLHPAQISALSNNNSTTSLRAAVSEEDSDNNTQRGRSADTEIAGSGRSQSTPRKHPNARAETNHSERDEGLISLSQETHPLPQRPASRHSSLHEQSEAASSVSSLNSFGPSTPSPPRNSESSRSSTAVSTSSSPSSFLSSLKSRSGDKQGLGNSAKEAMKKWGVIWGGLRKDGASGNAVPEDTLDQGSTDSRGRTDNNSNSLSHRARASYAEVRAAVTERKGKEKGEEGRISPAPTSDAAKGKGQEFAHLTTTTLGNPSPVTASATSDSSRHRSGSLEVNGALPNIILPSISRTTTEQSSNSESEGQEAVVRNPNDPPLPPSTIYTQPMQAKSMSIPGIHASHRGDLMSLGHVAPPASSESKPKNPAIQSVYRLWKSPNLSGQGTESSSQAQAQSYSVDKDGLPLSLPSDLQSTPSTLPRPPPLPPRSTPAAIPRSVHDGPQPLSDSCKNTSASEVLKPIAAQDEHMKASLERGLPASTSRRSNMQDIGHDVLVLQGGSINDADSDNLATPPHPQSSNSAPPLPPRRIQNPT